MDVMSQTEPAVLQHKYGPSYRASTKQIENTFESQDQILQTAV